MVIYQIPEHTHNGVLLGGFAELYDGPILVIKGFRLALVSQKIQDKKLCILTMNAKYRPTSYYYIGNVIFSIIRFTF